MLKLPVALSVLLALATPAAAAPVGADAARCLGGGPALLVAVRGLKSATGRLRVQTYGARPADFLAKGRKMRRIDLPVTATAMEVCIAVPGPGRYAVAVRHDTRANGSDWNDGGGFSRNPRLSIFNYEPKHAQVAIDVGAGVSRVPVIMQYRNGASIGPVRRGG